MSSIFLHDLLGFEVTIILPSNRSCGSDSDSVILNSNRSLKCTNFSTNNLTDNLTVLAGNGENAELRMSSRCSTGYIGTTSLEENRPGKTTGVALEENRSY